MGTKKARKLLKKAHANQYKHMYHNLIGSNANELEINNTALIFQIDQIIAKYWHTKQKNAKFHPDSAVSFNLYLQMKFISY